MIIGNGNIAKVLKNRDDLIFFASGVSNSSCEDQNEYNREFDLLKQQDKNTHLVYFSNLGIYYKNDTYTKHKIKIEDFITISKITDNMKTNGFYFKKGGIQGDKDKSPVFNSRSGDKLSL